MRAGGRVAAVGVLGSVGLLAACMPSGPDARRSAYLDCARREGVTVRDGTIVSRGPADLARLDACKALPR